MVCWIIVPFIASNLLFTIFHEISPKKSALVKAKDIDDEAYLKKIECRLDWWFRWWIVITVVEVVFSGGLPIVWLVTRNPKVYAEFGLPFVHVFVSTLLSVLALAKLGLYLLRGDRRRLLIPISQILWSFIIVSRGVMMIALIQGVVLWFCLKAPGLKTIFRAVALFSITILLFGYIGDLKEEPARSEIWQDHRLTTRPGFLQGRFGFMSTSRHRSATW